MQAEANQFVAMHFCQRGEVKEGLKYAQVATVLVEQAVKDDQLGTTDEHERLAASCWGALAQIYEDDNRQKEALAFREKALKHALLQTIFVKACFVTLLPHETFATRGNSKRRSDTSPNGGDWSSR